jgi:hypothetical protein
MSVTRSTNQIQVQVDLEIESTLRRLRKEARLNTMAIARQQTLKDLAAPNVENQPLCINIDNNVNFELKSGFILLLPTFNGVAGEDPHTHLKEFHMVCVGMKPNGVNEEQVKLKAFPFSRSKYWSAIQRWDHNLWHFSAVIPVWRHKTSSSTSRDSIGSPKNRASGYYCKYLSAIQRCDQKLWRFSAVILVSRDKTSSSTSRDSRGRPRKRASGNYCKYLSAIQPSHQKLWRFQLLFRYGATKPPLPRVGIP